MPLVCRLEGVYLKNLDMSELIDRARAAVIDHAAKLLRASPGMDVKYIVLDMPCSFFSLRSLRCALRRQKWRHRDSRCCAAAAAPSRQHALALAAGKLAGGRAISGAGPLRTCGAARAPADYAITSALRCLVLHDRPPQPACAALCCVQ